MISPFAERKAKVLKDRAEGFENQGLIRKAFKTFLQSEQLQPEDPETLGHIGHIYQQYGHWHQSLDYCQRASALAPEDKKVQRDLALAATAVKDWDLARQIWRAMGLPVKGQQGPVSIHFGMAPIRLMDGDDYEVVWAKRIDPVRAVITSVPFANKNFHYGDVVLHGSKTEETQEAYGIQYPLFNALEMFERSRFTTQQVTLELADPNDFYQLITLFCTSKHQMEDWTHNLLPMQDGLKKVIGVAVYDQQPIEPLFDIWQKQCQGKVLESASIH